MNKQTSKSILNYSFFKKVFGIGFFSHKEKSLTHNENFSIDKLSYP